MLTFDDIRGVGVSRMMMSAFFFSKLRPLTKLQDRDSIWQMLTYFLGSGY